MLIGIEGLDGVGKTTLAKKLVFHIKEHKPLGFDNAIYTRAPGGTELGEEIRALMLKNGPEGDPYTQMMLALAARRQQLMQYQNELYKPNILVVSDRLDWSTIVYQTASGLSSSIIESQLRQIRIEDGLPAMYFRIVGPYRLRGKTSPFDKAPKDYKEMLESIAHTVTHIEYRRGFAEVFPVWNLENETNKALDSILSVLKYYKRSFSS